MTQISVEKQSNGCFIHPLSGVMGTGENRQIFWQKDEEQTVNQWTFVPSVLSSSLVKKRYCVRFDTGRKTGRTGRTPPPSCTAAVVLCSLVCVDPRNSDEMKRGVLLKLWRRCTDSMQTDDTPVLSLVPTFSESCTPLQWRF